MNNFQIIYYFCLFCDLKWTVSTLNFVITYCPFNSVFVTQNLVKMTWSTPLWNYLKSTCEHGCQNLWENSDNQSKEKKVTFLFLHINRGIRMSCDSLYFTCKGNKCLLYSQLKTTSTLSHLVNKWRTPTLDRLKHAGDLLKYIYIPNSHTNPPQSRYWHIISD